MRTLALAGGKGGVGKTTVAVHIAVGKGTADALREERIGPEHIQEVNGRERLHLMPSTRSLADLDDSQVGAHTILRTILEDNANRWDFAPFRRARRFRVHSAVSMGNLAA